MPSPKITPDVFATATPVMRQYLEAKRQHPDAIVFFRMGDFYEMFYEDALTAARVLELTLTSRSKDSGGSPIPMCGVPHHAANAYITRLVKRNFRVAMCEQVEDPKKTKKLVRREVVRVVSPGTLVDSEYLDAREPAFLMAISKLEEPKSGDTYGVSIIDISTGEFNAAEYIGDVGRKALTDEISLLNPRELIVSTGFDLGHELPTISTCDLPVSTLDPWAFSLGRASQILCEQLHVTSLDGFDLGNHPAATIAAGALVQYLHETQKAELKHVRHITFRSRADHLLIDPVTFSHLEILEGSGGGRPGSLIAEIDRTVTPMGGRLLRAWLQRPAFSLERTQHRLDAVEEFAFRSTERVKTQDALKAVQDLERLVARIALGTAGPREVVALRYSLSAIPNVRTLLQDLKSPLIASLLGELDDVADVRDLIASTLVDEPPLSARDGGCIRDGVDLELDEVRSISRDAKHQITAMEAAERERTGITSLKIRYNRVFGYYIEVSKSNLHAVPNNYQRKQTIAHGERFITPSLKEYERKAIGADEELIEREQILFDGLRKRVSGEAIRIQASARSLASLDVLSAFAELAGLADYVKPHVHAGNDLNIREGRHPVVERTCPDQFVSNDIKLFSERGQVVILTGPNMGGKSTYLRQTALIVLLAHAGSFVPARQAKIPLIDRIFARTGASDNIASGQSTFMLEMQETSKILHTATSQSLVLLDEIGRGTATFDGLSLAWAVAEHLATNDRSRPKTLFATHYHELTDIADSIPGVVNYHVVAREWRDEILFLRKVEPGRSDRSYGIQVARLAGLPAETIKRATEILRGLERDELSRGGRPSFSGRGLAAGAQLGLFQTQPTSHSRLAEQLNEIDLDQLTPIDALKLLARLKKDLESSDS